MPYIKYTSPRGNNKTSRPFENLIEHVSAVETNTVCWSNQPLKTYEMQILVYFRSLNI